MFLRDNKISSVVMMSGSSSWQCVLKLQQNGVMHVGLMKVCRAYEGMIGILALSVHNYLGVV